jgi:hypothetical protein
MYFQRLAKDEWTGFSYEDMGLEGFYPTPEDAKGLTDAERTKKAVSFRDAERRRTRTDVAQALIEGELKAKLVTVYGDKNEVLDALVVGHIDNVDAVPDVWTVPVFLGAKYHDTVYAWMTLKNDAPVFILRASDENAAKRMEKFLEEAIYFIKRERESEAA